MNNFIPETDQLEKYEVLKKSLASLGSAMVAFSGGVDSAFLLKAAREALGDGVIAVTAASVFCPERELKEAKEFCEKLGVRHIIFPFDVLKREEIAQNPENRCYLCKKQLFSGFLMLAREHGVSCVLEGSNMDDNGDYRPGMQAIAELGIKSPLRACGFWKRDIRALSRMLGLPTWEKPSFACLASRFPYGDRITEEKLAMVDSAEQLLLQLGFAQFRVRIHGTIARIEVLPEEFDRLIHEPVRSRVVKELTDIGFSYVSMDLAGYRTGSMNEGLSRLGSLT